MKVCTTLSEDPESPSLNTKPHAREHCAVDGASLAAIDGQVGRQVLASLSPEQFALYTVTECIAGVARAAHVGSKGLARLAPDASPAPMPEYDATLETDFTGRGASALRLTEELLGDDTTGLAILAPHGGLIEIGTDVQARSAYTMLVRQGKPVRAWIAQGYNRVPGAHSAGTSRRPRSPSTRSPCSAPCSSRGGSLMPSPFTDTTTPRRSSWAADFHRTQCSAR